MRRSGWLLMFVALSLIFGSCKKDEAVQNPLGNPGPDITYTITPDHFALTVMAAACSNTLHYAVTFMEDSVQRTLVANNVSNGLAIVRICDTQSSVIYQDTIAGNTVETQLLVAPVKPGSVEIVLLNFSGSLTFTLVAAPHQPPEQSIMGAWEWHHSLIELPVGRVITPQTEGYTCQLYFLPDSTFALFRNDTSLVCRGTFSLGSNGSLHVSQYAFPLWSSQMRYTIFPPGPLSSTEEILFRADIIAFDLPESVFQRKDEFGYE